MPRRIRVLALLSLLPLVACRPAERRYFERGERADRADRRQEAEREYRAALAANADFAPAYLALSRLLVRSGRLSEVLAVAREGVRRFPAEPKLRSWYGDALLKRRRLAEAERELNRALALPGAGAYPHYTLGLLYLESGRTKEAREQLEQATALQSDAPEGWYQLANACDRLGDAPARDEALAHFSTLYAPPASPKATPVEPPAAPPVPIARPAASRPNLILISIDTLRADRLGCYGGPNPASPALDAMAREGTRFANAYAAAAWTLPSHMTMMTGLYPSAHGVNPDRRQFAGIQNSSESFRIRGSEKLATLAERLSRLGYRTSAITEGGWVAPKFGFDQGFSSYVAHDSDILDTGTQKLTLDWLADHAGSGEKPGAPERPFFLFVHTYQVHQPYHQPPPYDALFVPPGHRGYALPKASLPIELLDKFKDGSFPPTAADILAFRARYDGEVRHADAFVGHLLAMLRATGLDRDTIVLLTSDHGEELFEHGGFDHGETLYDEVLRVPMILWGPGRIPAGRTPEAAVGSIDILPTLVELAGGSTTGPNAPPIQGVSLIPRLADPTVGLKDRRLFAEGFTTAFHHFEDTDASIPLASVREGTTELIVHRSNPETVELFEITNDPGERRNLAAEQPETVARLRRAIVAWQKDGARLRALFGGATEKLDPETEKRLRALGYL